MTNYTFNAIEQAYNGSETVTFNAKVLEDFKTDDGTVFKGCLNDLNYLLRAGYVSSYQVSKSDKGYSITLQGFNPDIKVKSKKTGKEFTWFNTASRVKQVLMMQELIVKQETKKRKSA